MIPMERWPTVEASAETRVLVRIRQQATPGAGGPPVCPCCGLPILWDIHYHHRKKQRKGGWAGDGRPSNILAVHGRLEGAQCHFTAIEEDVARARANGWIILMSAPLAAYRMPVRLNYRAPGIDPASPWAVLDDAGGMRQATEAELGGSYGI